MFDSDARSRGFRACTQSDQYLVIYSTFYQMPAAPQAFAFFLTPERLDLSLFRAS